MDRIILTLEMGNNIRTAALSSQPIGRDEGASDTIGWRWQVAGRYINQKISCEISVTVRQTERCKTTHPYITSWRGADVCRH